MVHPGSNKCGYLGALSGLLSVYNSLFAKLGQADPLATNDCRPGSLFVFSRLESLDELAGYNRGCFKRSQEVKESSKPG